MEEAKKYMYLHFGGLRALYRYPYNEKYKTYDTFNGEVYNWDGTWEKSVRATDLIIEGDWYDEVEDVDEFIKEHQNDYTKASEKK